MPQGSGTVLWYDAIVDLRVNFIFHHASVNLCIDQAVSEPCEACPGWAEMDWAAAEPSSIGP